MSWLNKYFGKNLLAILKLQIKMQFPPLKVTVRLLFEHLEIFIHLGIANVNWIIIHFLRNVHSGILVNHLGIFVNITS